MDNITFCIVQPLWKNWYHIKCNQIKHNWILIIYKTHTGSSGRQKMKEKIKFEVGEKIAQI